MYVHPTRAGQSVAALTYFRPIVVPIAANVALFFTFFRFPSHCIFSRFARERWRKRERKVTSKSDEQAMEKNLLDANFMEDFSRHLFFFPFF